MSYFCLYFRNFYSDLRELWLYAMRLLNISLPHRRCHARVNMVNIQKGVPKRPSRAWVPR